MTEEELRSFDYLDETQFACLLCQRKLKSVEVLQRHAKESGLHKGNLENLETCRAGVDRKLQLSGTAASSAQSLVPAGFAPIGGSKEAGARPVPKYRDRALERRAVFGSEAAPAFTKGSDSTRSYEGPAAPPKSQEPTVSVEKEIDNNNIGSKMLAMMGWSKGQGLGSSRQGRTDIIETKVYAKGAGLGCAKPSGSQPPPGRSWKEYLAAAKDGARERYSGQQGS
ncbi:hypothetical protein ACQY0O_005804 [Thecaphora frezii]